MTMETTTIHTKRLRLGDRELASRLFVMMGEVFEEEREPLSDEYIDRLLAREDLWVIGAMAGDEVVGGITGHVLPMTRSESSEVFIYDLAVRSDYQRKGIGRQLMRALRAGAAGIGISDVFVAADDEDTHAIDFYHAVGGKASPVTFFTFSDPGNE